MRSLAIIALLLAALCSCRNYRTLEELEESAARAEALAADPEFAAPADPLVAHYERVVRLFVPGGAVAIVPAARVSLAAGQEHDEILSAAAGACYTVVAYGLGTNLDVDLALESPAAQEVAADRSPDPFPVIPAWCADESGPFRLSVRVTRGSGDVMYGVFALPEQAASAAERIESIGTRYLEEPRSLGPLLSAYLEAGENLSIPLATLPSRCFGIAAVADAGISDLDIFVLDDHGGTLTSDVGTDAEPVVRRFCAAAGGAIRVELRPYEGAGRVWWQVFEVAQGA